jgi:hypothetical protein
VSVERGRVEPPGKASVKWPNGLWARLLASVAAFWDGGGGGEPDMGGDGYARRRAPVSARLSAQAGSSADVVKSEVPRCRSITGVDNMARSEPNRRMYKAVMSTDIEMGVNSLLWQRRAAVVPRRVAVLKTGER